MATYNVVRKFRESEHDGRIYEVGDAYPAEGHKATQKRIKQLSTTNNKYGQIYIAAAESGED